MSSLLDEYIKAKEFLTHYKKKEAELRIELLDSVFPNADPGAHSALVGNIEVKADFGLNYSIDEKLYEQYKGVLSEEELACIKLKPTLIKAAYSDLADSDVLDEMITVKPAMPSVELKSL